MRRRPEFACTSAFVSRVVVVVSQMRDRRGPFIPVSLWLSLLACAVHTPARCLLHHAQRRHHIVSSRSSVHLINSGDAQARRQEKTLFAVRGPIRFFFLALCSCSSVDKHRHVDQICTNLTELVSFRPCIARRTASRPVDSRVPHHSSYTLVRKERRRKKVGGVLWKFMTKTR